MALLALYQWQLSAYDPADIIGHFLDDPDWALAVGESLRGRADDNDRSGLAPVRFDSELFSTLVRGAAEHADAIDDALRPLLDRSVTSLDPVERSILRIGTYELMHSPHLPMGVILNEAINLAKEFGAAESHRYINGVLDKLGREIRPDESRARRGR